MPQKQAQVGMLCHLCMAVGVEVPKPSKQGVPRLLEQRGAAEERGAERRTAAGARPHLLEQGSLCKWQQGGRHSRGQRGASGTGVCTAVHTTAWQAMVMGNPALLGWPDFIAQATFPNSFSSCRSPSAMP